MQFTRNPFVKRTLSGQAMLKPYAMSYAEVKYFFEKI
jgi:hypothetical protein